MKKNVLINKDLIGKDIWFVEPSDDLPPMKGKVIAIDIYNRIITEYDELEGDVFYEDTLDNIHFTEPVDDKIITVDGKKYIRID